MANSKQQQKKKKDRERRVARKKLAEAARQRAREKTAKDQSKIVPERTKLPTAAVPKPDYVPAPAKTPFTQRRGGG